MTKIRQFLMKDVRCFAGQQKLEIRPLTLLVGENSTGKSTALGCFQVLASPLSRMEKSVDFNVEPYSMGSFSDIVSRKRPAGKRFKLGFDFEENSTITFAFTEKEQIAEPMLEGMSVKFQKGELCFAQYETQEINREKPFVIDKEKTDTKNKRFHILCNFDLPYLPIYFFEYFARIFYPKDQSTYTDEENSLLAFLEEHRKRVRNFYFNFTKVFSFAPIRSRPKRTYDPTREFEDPEGSDIPIFMRMKSSQKEKWEELQNQLVRFGKSSGLFEKVEIKKHGKSMSDPFQIQIKVRGPKSNIMDVGYGVNQILPILVKIFSEKTPTFFLLQQPEVHLHPKGQAELASLFVRTIKERKHSFIIETHSDYIVDRARIEIKKGGISPKDVSLIYMEPKGAHVKVHNIGFDENANLTNVPQSYRKFFLRESDRLLGYED